jgi:hypothetical protein
MESEARIAIEVAKIRAGKPTPTTLDFVRAADRILTEDDPDYIGSTPEGRDFVADVLTGSPQYRTPQEIAAFLVANLTAE